VLAHAILLERIVRNLLSNAIRYTDKGGVLLGCRRRGNFLAIEVWDTGRGIAENQQEKIFNKFVQVSDEDREQRGGFGMGLAIVKQFVDSLGYKLSLHSKPGKGTVFCLMVPLVSGNRRQPRTIQRPNRVLATALPPPVAAPLNVADMRECKELRILVLDDHDDVRWGIKQHLQEWGFVVDDFAGEQEAAEYYRAGGKPPALIISDYELGFDKIGTDAITHLRTQLSQETPAFILTGTESAAVEEDIKNNGLIALCKPYKPARLRALINHFLAVPIETSFHDLISTNT
jgi:two-component system, sensor histidine kinase